MIQIQKYKAKRIDHKKWENEENKWVEGHYLKTPLTDENSGTDPKDGWFFLTGEERHCIVNDGVVFVVIPETIEAI